MPAGFGNVSVKDCIWSQSKRICFLLHASWCSRDYSY